MRLFIIISITFFSFFSFAKAKPWGAGIIIANPTGFSVKHRMSHKNSIDAALGYSLGSRDYLHIHGTYLWETNQGIKIDSKYLGYYFGVGGALFSWDRYDNPPRWVDRGDDDEFGLAARGSAGLNYYFNDPSFEVFLEASMHFFVIPDTDFDLGIALGGRFFF